MPILVVWLWGTLLLAQRRSGTIIMLIGSVIALSMPKCRPWKGLVNGIEDRFPSAPALGWRLFT